MNCLPSTFPSNTLYHSLCYSNLPSHVLYNTPSCIPTPTPYVKFPYNAYTDWLKQYALSETSAQVFTMSYNAAWIPSFTCF